MTERPSPPSAPASPEVTWIALALATVLLFAWSIPAAVVWLHDGTALPAVPAIKGTVQLISHQHWSDPATAYAARWRDHMPAGTVWWAGGGWAALTLISLAVGAWRQLDRLAARPTLGRSAHSLRGSRPRPWARRRDVTDLTVGRSQPGRFTLGQLDNTLLASDPEAHVAVIAPTRSGKTTRCVIPWLLEHDGPAIVTSTKTDVLHATRKWRAREGQIIIWDPFGPESAAWTPLTGCESWQHALSQAQWLADAAQQGDSEIATYWRGEAARLLAPLLHAAALAEGSIGHVLEWVDSQDTASPAKVLQRLHADPAEHQLAGIAALDPRNRGTVYMSAGSLLAAYRLPSVQATAQHGLNPQDFLDGGAHTLYIVASSRQQRLLAPLTVAILSSLLHAAAEHANQHGPLTPTLRVLLDETANIAPIRDLPAHLSQAAGHGVRIATIWQSLAQAQHRYGAATDEILANSTAKLYLGPVTDTTTRRHITDLLGEEPIDTASINTSLQHRSQTTSRSWRPKATASALQQLQGDRALLVEGRHHPAIIETRAWWQTRRLRRRGER